MRTRIPIGRSARANTSGGRIVNANAKPRRLFIWLLEGSDARDHRDSDRFHSSRSNWDRGSRLSWSWRARANSDASAKRGDRRPPRRAIAGEFEWARNRVARPLLHSARIHSDRNRGRAIEPASGARERESYRSWPMSPTQRAALSLRSSRRSLAAPRPMRRISRQIKWNETKRDETR